MTDRDKSILEEPEKMCEYCCNFDKEHIGMDCTALCKLTMTLAYAEDYGGNCMFYNVPKEQIIVPPCKVGDTVYEINTNYPKGPFINRFVIIAFHITSEKNILGHKKPSHAVVGVDYMPSLTKRIYLENFGKTVFLTKEEAEAKLKELGK